MGSLFVWDYARQILVAIFLDNWWLWLLAVLTIAPEAVRRRLTTFEISPGDRPSVPLLKDCSRVATHERKAVGTFLLPNDDMRCTRPPRHIRLQRRAVTSATATANNLPRKAKQTFDMFLVLDIEGTCKRGSDFNYPNEIIEFPVCLLGWKDKGEDMTAGELEVVAEFRTFVKPTWQPILSDFCKELTGITQEQVDCAPTFREVLVQFEDFMVKYGLIDEDGNALLRFCWCTDGPFDIRDFVVKQCFISKLPLPWWLKRNVLDVRTVLLQWLKNSEHALSNGETLTRRTLNIAAQLRALHLDDFVGRQHSGIDDARNIARVVTELGRKGVHLLPNINIQPNRRWAWMGKKGQILEEFLT